MKATLKFNLPDDDADYARANKATDMVNALWDFGHYLRKVDKYETGDDIDKIRTQFYDTLNHHGIILDDLIE